jgi:multidrug/hemolysin transport system permease protein
MIALVKRDLLLYLRNPSRVLFSLLGAMISFILYLLFLKDSILTQWQALPNSAVLLDQWVIGGTLAITGITTSMAGLAQVVADWETDARQDLLQTDIGNTRLTLSYVTAAALIAFMMQIVMFVLMTGYFHIQDGLQVTLTQTVLLLGLMVLSSVLGTAVNLLIVNFVQHMSSMASLNTVIGTGAGFLVGGLIPIGTLPHFAQNLVKITPGSYIAALNRQVLMHDQLGSNFKRQAMRHTFEQKLGVRIDWQGLLTGPQTLNIVIVATVGLTLIALVPPLLAGRQRRRLLA